MIKEKDGQKYLVLGDKAIPFDEYDENGKPKIDVEVEREENENGGQDVTVKVDTLKVKSNQKDLK